MTKTVAFFNAKGGVGTTTLAAHTCFLAAERDLHVVGVSVDKSADLSRWIGPAGIRWSDGADPWPAEADLVVVDVFAQADPERLRPDLWVMPISNRMALDNACRFAPRLNGPILCVWNQAPRRQFYELVPGLHGPMSRFAAAEIPWSAAIEDAYRSRAPVWSRPRRARSPGAHALRHALDEVLGRLNLPQQDRCA